MEFSYSLAGFDEVERLLKALPDRMATRVLSDSVRAGAKVVQKEMQRQAPIRTGLTRQSIGIFRKKVNKDGALFGVGPYKRVRAAFGSTRAGRSKFAKGTKKNIAALGRSKKIRRYQVALWLEKGFRTRGGGRLIRKPFLGPSFEASASQTLRAVMNEMGEGFARQSRELAREFGSLTPVKKRRGR